MTVDELVVNIKANISGFTGKINEARQQISQVGQSAQSGAKDIQSMSSTAGSAASSMKNSFAGIAKAAVAAFSIKKLVDFGKESLELASDLQEVQNVVDTSFGDMSAQVDAWAKTTIDKFGMSETSAKRTASTYMAMSKGMGQYGEAAADMAIKAAERTGDIASFYNMSQSEADTMMKSIWTGETESLKRIGVVMTQTNLDAYALANGFGKTTDAMTQAEQVQLRYQYVMEQTSLAAGDFEKTGGGWANQVRVLSERFNQLKTSIGSAIMQVALPVLQALNNVMSKVVAVANEVANALSGLFGTPKAETAAVANNTEQALSAQQALTSEVKKTGDAAKKAAAGFDEMTILSSQKSSGGTESAAVTTGGGVSFDGSALETIGEQSETLGKLKKFLEPLSKISFKPLIDSLKKLGQAMKPLGQTLFKGLEWAYTNVFAPMAKFAIEDVLPRFLETLGSVTKIAGKIIEEQQKNFEQFYTQFLKPIADYAAPKFLEFWDNFNVKLNDLGDTITNSEAFEDLRSILEKVYNFLVPIVTTLFDIQKWFSDFAVSVAFAELEKLWRDLEDAIGTVAALLDGDFSGAWEHFKELMIDNKIDNAKDKLNILKEKFGEVKETVGKWVDHWKESIAEFINTWKEKITGWWDENVAPWFTAEKWNEVLQGMVDGFAETWNKVYDFFTEAIPNWWNENIAPWFTAEKWSEIWDNVKEGVKSGWNKVVAFFTESIPAWWNEHIAPWFTKEKWIELLGKVKAAFISVFEGVKNAIKVPINAIIGFINKIIGGLNKLHIDVPAIKGITDGFTIGFNIPQIPELASGGIATSATHAVIGEAGKEAVLPLENNTEWMDILAERINGGTPERLVLQVGETVLGEVVLNSLNSLTRQRGGLDLVMA